MNNHTSACKSNAYGGNPLAFHYSSPVTRFISNQSLGGCVLDLILLVTGEKEYSPVHTHGFLSHLCHDLESPINQTRVFEVLEHIYKFGYFQAHTLAPGGGCAREGPRVCVCVRQCDGVMKQPSLTPLCLYSGQWRSACLCESAGEKNISKEP